MIEEDKEDESVNMKTVPNENEEEGEIDIPRSSMMNNNKFN